LNPIEQICCWRWKSRHATLLAYQHSRPSSRKNGMPLQLQCARGMWSPCLEGYKLWSMPKEPILNIKLNKILSAKYSCVLFLAFHILRLQYNFETRGSRSNIQALLVSIFLERRVPSDKEYTLIKMVIIAIYHFRCGLPILLWATVSAFSRTTLDPMPLA
jgi:hypothetical protein